MNAKAKRQFKDALFGEFERIGKALASGKRLEIIDLLAQRDWSVEDLANEMAQSVANTSQHLQVLRQAQLVETRREGTFIRYRLADDRVTRVWLALRELGESRFPEVDRLVATYLKERPDLEAIDTSELRRRIKEGNTIVVDVRSIAEFEAGHIKGAWSIPIEELSERLRELPKKKTIVAYCRGPYCVFADEAATLLSQRGFRSLRFEGGYPGWKLAGGAVAQGVYDQTH